MSAHLEARGRSYLDPRWTIVPVGGLAGVSAYCALLEARPGLAVLSDVSGSGSPTTDSRPGRGMVAENGIIRLADFVQRKTAGGAAAGGDGGAPEADGADGAADAGGDAGAGAEAGAEAAGDAQAPGANGAAGDAGEAQHFGPANGETAGGGPHDPSPGDGLAEALAAAVAAARDVDAAGGESGSENGGAEGAGVEEDAGLDFGDDAGVEDLFAEEFYLGLVNGSGAASVEPFEIRGRGRIVRRIEAATGLGLDRYLPARLLLDREAGTFDGLDDDTFERFESLFRRVNLLLEP